MERTAWLLETRIERFDKAHGAWTEGRLTQEEAARLLGVCERTFRCYVDRYEESGLVGTLTGPGRPAEETAVSVENEVVVAEGYQVPLESKR